jgi:hypothetical protein
MRQPHSSELGWVSSRHNGRIFASDWLLYLGLVFAGASVIWLIAGSCANANDIVTHMAVSSEGGRFATISSAIALLFSGFSLWQTSLKQADLSVYVTDAISYTRDHAGEDAAFEAGGYEVLAVPVTIANGGARGGAVVSLRLDAKDPDTGHTACFKAAYTADATYFAAREQRLRPQSPFTALVIAGRSVWSGTILFYSADYKAERLVTKAKSKVEATLTLVTPESRGWLDRMLGKPVPPVTLALEVPDIWDARLQSPDQITRFRFATARP